MTGASLRTAGRRTRPSSSTARRWRTGGSSSPATTSGPGLRAILSTGFADIFRSNALKNGLLPITVEPGRHRQLFELSSADPNAELTVELDSQVVHLPGDEDLPFEVDPFAKVMLLAGTDELGYLLGRLADIDAWDASHPARIDTRLGTPA